MSDVDVRLVQVTKTYGDAFAVDHVDLDVVKGEFFSLLGPSGCGKTTTLRMIGGFEQPTSGLIELQGTDVTWLPPYQRHVNTHTASPATSSRAGRCNRRSGLALRSS